MKQKYLSVIISIFILASLACQAAYRLVLEPTVTPHPDTATVTSAPTTTSTALPPEHTETLQPSPVIELVTATPQPSATALFNPHAQSSVTPTPLPLDLQLRVFEDLWQVVKDEYLYPDFNGLDWDAIYVEFRNRIEAGLSNADFYLAMDEMIFRLGDDHSVFLSPEMVAEEQAEYEGNYDYVGIGVLASAVPERNRAAVLVVFPDSPAERAGLKPRDSILEVNGEAILDEEGNLKPILRGPEGSPVTIILQSPGQKVRELIIIRQPITGSLPVPYTVLTTVEGKRIGYIFIATFADSTIDESVARALRQMSTLKRLDGLIIDNRENSGGADTVMRPILGYFTRGVVGKFISRQGERDLNLRDGENIRGSQDLPLVVLVGKGTASFGEIFSGILKDFERAYLIGTTTDGNVETLWGYDFEDGSHAWIAHEFFRPLNNPEQNWEQTGIIPDLIVDANWVEFSVEEDPAVVAALAHFSKP